MAILTAPLLVPKPTPDMPLRYGILQAAIRQDLPLHARSGGLQYTHAMCGDGFGYALVCPPSAQASKNTAAGTGVENVLGSPFIVFATLRCGPVGETQQDFESLVVQRLRSVEQGVVEEALSTGGFGQDPSLLAADGIVTVAGGGTTVSDVVSELERAMYCSTTGVSSGYGVPAYLHMPIPVFNELKTLHMIDFDGTRWRTPIGTVVSTGCYAGNDPAGAAPAAGTFWIYITGQTTVWRTPDSEIFVSPIEGSLNRTTNQMQMLAEREYVVTYECDGFAKPVTLW
jgi:hypothetical protein